MKVLHGTCLLALALVARDDTPRYAPKEGAQLARVWTSHLELDLDKLEIKFRGQTIDGSALGLQMHFDLVRNLELTDAFAVVKSGSPERVERAFAKAHATTTLKVEERGTEHELKLEGDSPLVDKTVIFAREGESWKPSFAEDSEGDDALLEDLEQDLDLAGLLPEKTVEVGASWEPEAKALDAFLRPGGSLKIELEASGDKIEGAEILDISPDLLFGSFEGEVKATLTSVEEKDGARLAHIKLEIDVQAKKDLADVARQAIEAAKKPEGVSIEVQEAADELGWKGEGELVWDLEAGHLRSASLEGEIEVSFHLRLTQSFSGEGHEMEQSMSFSGKLSASFEVEQP